MLEQRTLLSRTIHVDAQDNNGDAANDGSSWAAAYTTLTDALAEAQAGDDIRIGQGTYKPTTTTDRNISFNLKNGVGIYGGYAGYAAPDPDARDITAYATILSGDIRTLGYPYDNSVHVIVANNVDASAILDGVSVVAGAANGAYPGGGLYSVSASPTIRNCAFADNASSAVYLTQYSAPALLGCTFTNNSGSDGGAINSVTSSPFILDCTFVGNSVENFNRAPEGGAIYSRSSSPTLVNCTFIRNSASTGGGGAIAHGGTSLTLIGCHFLGNSANGGGAIAAIRFSSTPSSCHAVGCSFVGNFADGGGAAYIASSTITFINSTFSDNSATADGAIYITRTGTARLTNCILRNNTPTPISGTATVHHSLVEGGYAGTANIDADPLFVRNPSPGPDDTWGTLDDDYGDLHLQPGSPAIDAGDAASLPADAVDLDGDGNVAEAVPLDLDGRPRVSGSAVDMGAYEAFAGASAITFTGTDLADSLYLRLSPDQETLEVWRGSTPSASPISTYPVASVSSCTFAAKAGANTLYLDYANGDPLPSASASIASDGAGRIILLNLSDSASPSLDLRDDELIVEVAPEQRQLMLDRLRSLLSGRQIISSQSDSMHDLRTSFNSAGNLRVKLALIGDVNEDGALDGDDYFALDRAFLLQEPADPAGDWTHDGRVDAADYIRVDRVFLQLPAVAAAPAAQGPAAALSRDPGWLAEIRPIL